MPAHAHSENNVSLRGVVFDAYGTLFDVYSVAALAESLFPGKGAQIARQWRVSQLDYTRLRSLSERYAPFSVVTRDALRHACASCGAVLDAEREAVLMGAYDRLLAFEEVRAAIERLRSRGLPIGILSNGDPPMLASAIAAAGLQGLIDHVLSADTVKRYKTAPEVYALAPAAFGCPAQSLLFVSSNGWDACAATWYGFRTLWINRGHLMLDELGVHPHREGRTLDDVVRFATELLQPAQPGGLQNGPQATDSGARGSRGPSDDSSNSQLP